MRVCNSSRTLGAFVTPTSTTTFHQSNSTPPPTAITTRHRSPDFIAPNSVEMASPNKHDSPIQAGLDESAELDRRIKGLPQELQDEILGLTVAIEPASVDIDRSYKPPWQLAINKALRQKVAQKYYSSTLFVTVVNDRDEIAILNWLSSLSADHRHLISEIRLCLGHNCTMCNHFDPNTMRDLRKRIWLGVHRQIISDLRVGGRVFKGKKIVEDDQGNTREVWL
ncbi:hypothetical protein CBER1_08697 [Cercospora berteroae]|uniref:Uncharacterized protein n=1 Tax=Cercospora berteroae TaxID=357750 RepID=A0A2S6C6K3_9PEZI|nr:hypothetical protein CBER1_08697 [Cercospora berteroae]